MALRSKRSFAAYGPGGPRVVKAGQIVADDDPVVKGREDAFESVDAHLARRPRTEQATAGPGEVRTVAPSAETAAFDPGAHKADEVLAYLQDADEDERARVLAAEAAGKNRKGILDKAE
ncbi:hypothetical protein SUDANB145_07119 (plasmid) [Streptomyces sp. enrichment culture]|uniref:hypothetical protein n=1 Tax=Streptomyces sp. enrichment culture TaxID=1795815 RepID=UPI003F56920E